MHAGARQDNLQGHVVVLVPQLCLHMMCTVGAHMLVRTNRTCPHMWTSPGRAKSIRDGQQLQRLQTQTLACLQVRPGRGAPVTVAVVAVRA